MSKQFVAIVIAVIIGLFGIFALTSKKDSKNNDTGSSNSSSSKLSNHVMGANKKKVTLVEYGDYQCPACGAYYPVVKQVTDKYAQDIQFQFRNFPLTSIHPNAYAGARAAEAAGKQGKYWEMHDMLYEQQQSWESSSNVNPIFDGYAEQLGLDVTKFKADFSSSATNDIIRADMNEGTRLGINATPTFFLQGKKIEDSPRDLDGFSKIIDKAIKDASK